MKCEWDETKGCLSELVDLLKCEICKDLVSKPVSLGGCEHFFCRNCVDDLSQCPICQMPSHAKDIQTDRQLATAASLCKQLNQILLSNDEANFENEQEHAAEAGSKDGVEGKNDYSVFDFIGSPAADSPSTSVAGRTRKRTKKTKRKKATNISNQMWNIGDRKMERCNSCGGSNSRKVCFNEGCENKTTHVESNTSTRKRQAEEDIDDIQNQESIKTKANQDCDKISISSSVSQPWVQITPVKDPSLTKKISLIGGRTRKINSASKTSKPIVPDSDTPNETKKSSIRTTKVSSKSPKNSLNISLTTLGKQANPLTKKNAKGETPLQVATIKGDVKKVIQLLKDGAPINVKDYAGWTPLHEACNHGYLEIARLLLDHGAFVSIPGLDNDTPLHDAVVSNRVEIVKLLVSRGAAISARNINGKTPQDLVSTDEMKLALQTPVDHDLTPATPATSTSSLSNNEVVILPTGLSREQKNTLQKCAQTLHCKVVDEYSQEVTHVVSSINKEGYCGRTIKNLSALVAGKWIVNFDWIDICIEYKEKVCEDAFEVGGMSTCLHPQAPLRSRTNYEKQLPGLWDGCHFYLQGEFEYPAPSREDLAALLKSGGGLLLTREPKEETIDQSEMTVPYHAVPGGAMACCSYFTITSNNKIKPQLHCSRRATVPYSWVFDCITNFKILDIGAME